MLFGWFNSREAAEAGSALADEIPLPTTSGSPGRGHKGARHGVQGEVLREFFRRAGDEIRTRRLNFFKRVMLANSFKWRLLEKGVEPEIAHDVTQTLVLHISLPPTSSEPTDPAPAGQTLRAGSGTVRSLSVRADESYDRGAYAQALSCYRELVALKPRNPDALNRLGASLCKLGRYHEAEEPFRRAIGIKAKHPDAHANLGLVYLATGRFREAESSLLRALSEAPGHLDARSQLGLTLVYLGRLRDAGIQFEKVLKVAPRHAEALHGMALRARSEGRFEEAEAMLKRALDADPKMFRAWAALAGLRKMKSSDANWLKRAEEIALNAEVPPEEACVRFAIGKYYDDVGEFARAFTNYKRANELLATISVPYKPDARTRLADDMIRVYTRETISHLRTGAPVRSEVQDDASASMKPVFVVGMMRSGTSLAEQIIASHPAASGAGELYFWGDVMRKHRVSLRRELAAHSLRTELAETYLRVLADHSPDALRIVDKAPANCDYLGLIHSVFPNARVIYMQRDPIDTCLSCYFQQFSTALNFTMDLSDLAHYYSEHQRLISHWRAVLPPGFILDVPYDGLVADQEGWTRKIIEFLGLEWDERCLDFHRTNRPVATSSYWQVRQKMYGDSVQRWHHYRQFIGPLLDLKDR